MTSSEYLRGRSEMKADLVAALQAQFARETGHDQCARATACPQCEDWYRAIDVAERCSV